MRLLRDIADEYLADYKLRFRGVTSGRLHAGAVTHAQEHRRLLPSRYIAGNGNRRRKSVIRDHAENCCWFPALIAPGAIAFSKRIYALPFREFLGSVQVRQGKILSGNLENP